MSYEIAEVVKANIIERNMKCEYLTYTSLEFTLELQEKWIERVNLNNAVRKKA